MHDSGSGRVVNPTRIAERARNRGDRHTARCCDVRESDSRVIHSVSQAQCGKSWQILLALAMVPTLAPTVHKGDHMLTRAATGLGPAPVRIVHLGLGAFHRAHQAWYTDLAADGWGIAAFTGRSPAMAERLSSQDGLYTLVERGAEGDSARIVSSIVEAIDGARLDRFVELVAAPTTAIVTLTITENGYRLDAAGRPNENDPKMAADLAGAEPSTPLGRLLGALEARRASDAPLAIVPCDNIPGNGPWLRRGLLAMAERRDRGLAAWIDESVSFVSTSVDRITPRAVAADRHTVEQLTGHVDIAPVITEPFHDWILSGQFPAGSPDWAANGARLVEDIQPFEQRKVWMLNGAHSLLAYLGQLRGHRFVADAIADPVCREWVLRFWDEAVRTLGDDSLGLDEYRSALLGRFENSRIRHELAQIAADGSTKLQLRILPIARAERSAGRDAAGCATAIAAWIAASGNTTTVRAAIASLDSGLATDSDFVRTVRDTLTTMQRETP